MSTPRLMDQVRNTLSATPSAFITTVCAQISPTSRWETWLTTIHHVHGDASRPRTTRKK